MPSVFIMSDEKYDAKLSFFKVDGVASERWAAQSENNCTLHTWLGCWCILPINDSIAAGVLGNYSTLLVHIVFMQYCTGRSTSCLITEFVPECMTSPCLKLRWINIVMFTSCLLKLLKVIVHPKKFCHHLLIHHHVIQNSYGFLFSSEDRGYFEECW